MTFAHDTNAWRALDAGDAGGDAQPPADEWRFERVSGMERGEIERFIALHFRRAYGARLRRFFPEIIALRRREELVAACGLHRAGHGPLFLECYLDAPAEHVLSAAAREPVGRGDMVEVGNLAVARAGVARELIVRLTARLRHQGLQWTVFSAVPSLRNNFVRLGIPLLTLAPADGNRLPAEERGEWGRYYESAPCVSAVSVQAAHTALARQPPCTR
jgi:hypothetical protein